LSPSRTAAQRAIESGRVSWQGPQGREVVAKPAQLLAPNAQLFVETDEADRYVSRGGLKLAGALAHSRIDVSGMHCLDVGQSTGGFSDCLLQAGATHVLGLDVGHQQLHRKLREDARITCIEGINARSIDRVALSEHYPADGFDLIVADLSFISLTKVLAQLPPLLKADGQMLLLVKPQFEVGADNLGKGGIVRDPALYAVVEADLRQAACNCGLTVVDWFDSPITGGDGNREFFMWTRHESH
ncbi:MAG TPA: TlyA family RNA methyltransferase, partial [Rhodocyclaceae bacterium]